MTKKEKANQLVRNFKGRGMDGDENYAAKECAIIVVDEILIAVSICYSEDMVIDYWKEVKQEIEKL